MPEAESDVGSIPALGPRAEVSEEIGNGTRTVDSITYPPGLVGDLGRYVYESSHRPVVEVALASALALGAGVAVGKTWVAKVVHPLMPLYLAMVVALMAVTFLTEIMLWLPRVLDLPSWCAGSCLRPV
jgi:hypothetical protein